MGVEKHSSKSGGGYVGGLLQLFDWNVKSRKKLFAGKSDLPDGSKQGKKTDDNLPATRFLLIEDENRGVSSAKGGSDYSCASSVTDDEVNGSRAPGVVARLMGLESLPTTTANEPYTTSTFDSHSLQDPYYQRTNTEFLNKYRTVYSNDGSYKVDGKREIVEHKPPKFPNRPIDRFLSEPLPPKSAKPVAITHHKLLSPIKSPGFISPKSAAHIMEAAAKILDPGLHMMSKGKVASLGSSSIPKVRDLRENMTVSHNQMKIPEAPKRPVDSNAAKLLKGQSLNKSWNGSEETPIFRASPEVEETYLVGSKNKGKSVSLAVQAKVNVQKREGLNPTSKNLVIQKDEDEYRLKQPFKSQRSIVKNEQNKPTTLSVLRQNNQKQNCIPSREKLSSKSSVSSQQTKKVNSSDSSSGQCKSLSKGSANARGGYKKECNEVSGHERPEALAAKTKHFPRKKRAIGSEFSEKSSFIHTNLVDTDDRPTQPHLAINEHRNLGEGVGRSGMDVVSFTFTSPMTKASSHSLDYKVEKQENFCYISPHGDKNGSISKGRKVSSLGLNVIGGDALSILLEQKLRELTSGIESSTSNSIKAGSPSVCILQDLVSAFNTVSTNHGEYNKKPPLPQKDQLCGESKPICLSSDLQVHNTNIELQNAKAMAMDNTSSDTLKEDQYRHPSPVSILEATFSNESCLSSESCESFSGCRQSSGEANFYLNSTSENPLLPVDSAELSDSASSSSQIANKGQLAVAKFEIGLLSSENQELEYIRIILVKAEWMMENFLLGRSHEVLDSTLFDQLENEGIGSLNEMDDNRQGRKFLFDCVSECLNLKYGQHVKGGYGTWAKGMVILRSDRLSQEIYKEISEWRNMSEWMVDELVDKDMSSHLGRWTNFEAEEFEAGIEIEEGILWSLIDEMVADMQVSKTPLSYVS